ncbi:hypothetical protein NQD34_001871 [Periophthalmus magnuspinnatus]|uniref:uncharacterized protein LOC117387092 n=1 Tax=Periophthalmus magnuspinnatus TaxID=409849 RepID=UPI00145AA491|nr:uncharacterized protein LOC117387092 [Periophthalmus magnuspinnatus]KAJ0002075.1 hypothetical protein NQD34_001871 [Periophthalmus magnuspinnatus]
MSTELHVPPRPRDTNGSVQTTTTGGAKPLHRFIKGQPKIVGIIVLVLGTSIFTVTAVVVEDRDVHYISTVIPPGFLQGTLYIICGVLYILTEHYPTKKTVTISLALSIVTLLGTLWTILHILPDLAHMQYVRHYEYMEENVTESDYFTSLQYENMGRSLEVILLIKFLMGGIIFVVMSTLGGIALRSTNSQAIVVMTTAQTEPTAE